MLVFLFETKGSNLGVGVFLKACEEVNSGNTVSTEIQ